MVGPSYERFVSFVCVEHVRSYVTNPQFLFIIKEENHKLLIRMQFNSIKYNKKIQFVASDHRESS